MTTNHVLWVNPSFGDYRVPLYQGLNTLLHGQFYLIFGKHETSERCVRKVQAALGDHAVAMDAVRHISLVPDNGFANHGLAVMIPSGLYAAIRRLRPKVIIAEGYFKFTPWALWYAIVHRIPLFIAYERTSYTERHCPWWRRAYRRLINCFVSGYIVNGCLTRAYLISQGVKPQRIFTGGMCADSDGLARAVTALSEGDLRQVNLKIGRPDGGLLYLFVGQLIERKGVRYLLDAWNRHVRAYPQDMLLLIGQGEQRAQLELQSADFPNVRFLGAVDFNEIAPYYAVADVFVLPTLEDNWSLVVPEAMACGLPVATSIYNGCHPELVHSGQNGIVFDPLKPEELVSALAYFHQVDLLAFSQASRRIESEYSPTRTAENILEALRSAITIDDCDK